MGGTPTAPSPRSPADASRPRRRPPLPPGPYLIAGVARAGQAAARALAAVPGADVRAWDRADSARTQRAAAGLAEAGVAVSLGGDGADLLDASPAPHCLVKSPGIGFDVALVAAAQARGLPVLDELEVGWRLDRRPVVAVTGTNGKSTVCELVRAALAAAGGRPGLAGNTAFGPPLSGLPADAADVVVAEVSSLQLEGSPAFLPEVAVLTNLSQDHLDRHRTMAAYAAAKRRIALRDEAHAPVAVVGVRERFGRDLARDLRAAGTRVLTVGGAGRSDAGLKGWEPAPGGARVHLRLGGEPVEARTLLTGEHNARNVVTALAVAEALGLPRQATLTALARTAAPPGRLERVAEGPVEVLVDYAHNPDGIREALRAARARCPEPGARLHVVASALRVLTTRQRRAMGRAAAEGSDRLVLSLDRIHPAEPPDALPPGLEAGARAAGAAEVHVVPDRRAAIADAIAAARPGDVVAILGRGERAHTVDAAGEVAPVDDRQAAREALRA
ncbi:MAG: UDP-N-acetylmuramoylalanine--D-glutamate ligase [Solirubrobacteraceae bacterium]|nr:UDP-N-acetylmuramoylalanine--D-glutamate ligase [Solirubrobacteraceae bacterium]